MFWNNNQQFILKKFRDVFSLSSNQVDGTVTGLELEEFSRVWPNNRCELHSLRYDTLNDQSGCYFIDVAFKR